MWRAEEHSKEENVLWARLRAIEWQSLPTFLSQPIVPISLYFYPSEWLIIVASVFVADIVWAYTLMQMFVSPQFANFSAYFVRLKWIACPVTAFLLWHNGHTYVALLALTWPWVMLAISVIVALTMIKAYADKKLPLGTLGERFMLAIGYTVDAE